MIVLKKTLLIALVLITTAVSCFSFPINAAKINSTIPSTGTISGMISGTEGVFGWLQLYKADTYERILITTDPDGLFVQYGNYSIPNVAPGIYKLYFYAPIGGGVPDQWYQNALSYNGASVITVSAGAVTNNINFNIIVPPDISPSESNFDFQTQRIGSISNHSFSVDSFKPIPFQITAVYLTGTDKDDFTITDDHATGKHVYESNLTFNIVFNPKTIGQKNASVIIVHDNDMNNTATISLTGMGTATNSYITGAVTENHVLSAIKLKCDDITPDYATLLAVLYDPTANKALQIEVMKDVTLQKNDMEQVVPLSNNITYSDSQMIKIFMWNNLNDIKPLSIYQIW